MASLSFEAMSLQIFAWESQPLEENKDLSEIGFQQAWLLVRDGTVFEDPLPT